MDAIMDSGLIKNCQKLDHSNSLELVKNASVFNHNGVTYIKHYNTVIFAYDSVSKICEVDYDCSSTSNRQIHYALNHFGIPQASCIDVHTDSKNSHSGAFN